MIWTLATLVMVPGNALPVTVLAIAVIVTAMDFNLAPYVMVPAKSLVPNVMALVKPVTSMSAERPAKLVEEPAV